MNKNKNPVDFFIKNIKKKNLGFKGLGPGGGGVKPFFTDLFHFTTIAKRSSSSSIRYIMCYILKSTVLDLFKQT